MLKELNYDITSWWNDQSFHGKDLFKVTDLGALSLCPYHFLKERIIAYVSVENGDVVLKNLQEKYLGMDAKMRELEVEWLATEDKMKLADKIEHVKDWMQHLNAVGDFEKHVKIILDWEQTINTVSQENYNAKLKLAELAESLVESDNWKEASQTFREIGDKWKLTGHLDRTRNDKLFNRIEVARKKFHERKRHFQEEEGKDMINNLDLKMEIIEQAEALANSEDWKNTSEVFHKLMESWKTIGKTPNKKNEELWQRLVNAKNTFFDRKKVHFNDVQQEQEGNLVLKLALIERAEALKDSTDWVNTTAAFATIMDEWKKIGKVPLQKADEVWKKLNDASNQFFEAKKRHIDEIKQTHESNYNLKMVLVKRAEEIKDSTLWNETTEEFGQLLDEWKQIGPVAREHTNTMWESFLAARKHFFARKDADRDKRKQDYEARNSARIESDKAREASRLEYEKSRQQAQIEEEKNKVTRQIEELKEEEEKLADFNAAILNIAPGKKAAQLKAHLENLIVETTANIKRLKERQAREGSDNQKSRKEHA